MNIGKILFCILTAVCAACGTVQKVTQNPIHQELVAKVGDEMASILSSPDKVTFHILQNEATAKQVFPDYYRKDEGVILSAGEVAVVQFLFTENPDCFGSQQAVVAMAPFLPFNEFVFQKGKESVSLVVSTSDMSWAVVRDGDLLHTFTYTDVTAVKRLIKTLIRGH